MKTALALTILAGILGGCSTASPTASSTASSDSAAPKADATDIDPAKGEPNFWLKKPTVASVNAHDFDRLWDSAEHVSEHLLFAIDRRDRRSGLMTTVPNVSPQWFEPWRRELQSNDDLANSSIAAYRRTIYWQFEQQGGGYTVTPRVLIERETIAERPISAVLDRAYFRPNPKDPYYGTTETDQGIILPQNNWYPVGRDYALETKLAELIRDRLQG